MSWKISVFLVVPFIALMYLGFLVWLDTVAKVFRPLGVDIWEGSEEVSGENAHASHRLDREIGDFTLDAAVEGPGRAVATMRMGHNLHFEGNRSKDTRLVLEFDYTPEVSGDKRPAQTELIARAVFLPVAGSEEDPIERTFRLEKVTRKGKRLRAKAGLRVATVPDQHFTFFVEIQAKAEIPDTTAPVPAEASRKGQGKGQGLGAFFAFGKAKGKEPVSAPGKVAETKGTGPLACRVAITGQIVDLRWQPAVI
jgi:hypothetical protein